MRNKALMMAVCVLVLSLTACGNKNNAPVEDPAASVEETVETEAPTIEPTEAPTPEPTVEPTPEPTATPEPTMAPITMYANTACNVREEENAESSKVGALAFAQSVTVTSLGDWNGVVLEDGTVGYVKANLLSETKPEPTPEPTMVYALMNYGLREAPDGNSSSVGQIQYGEGAVLIEAGEWNRVMLSNGAIGYMKGSMMSDSKPKPKSTPVPATPAPVMELIVDVEAMLSKPVSEWSFEEKDYATRNPDSAVGKAYDAYIIEKYGKYTAY